MTTGTLAPSPEAPPSLPHERWQAPVIALLITALALGAGTIMAQMAPAESWRYLPAIVFVVALEGVYTTLWLKRPAQLGLDGAAYRLAEIVAILLVVRLASWAIAGGLPDGAELRRLLLEPARFLDRDYVLLAIVTLAAWDRALALAHMFNKLALTPAEISVYGTGNQITEKAEGRDKLRPINRSEVLADYARQWVWGGLFLGICAVLASFDLAQVGRLGGDDSLRTLSRLPLPRGLLIALLLYFISGLWLLSQGRLAVMRARWIMDGFVIDQAISSSWHRNSLVLLLLVAAIAAFLPIGSTLGIAQILDLVVYGFVILANLLLLLLFFLLSLPFSMMGRTEEQQELEQIPFEIQPPETFTTTDTAVSETARLVMGSFFWAVVIIITTIALLFFLRERGLTLNTKLPAQLWRQLREWWRTFWYGLGAQLSDVRGAIQNRLQITVLPKDEGKRWRFVRLNALSAREKVYYFYLSTVRRAGQRGVPRRQSETPLEYSSELQESWPDAEENIEALTAAFLQARYSERPLDEDRVEQAKANWKEVRANLTGRNRPPDQESGTAADKEP